MIFREKAGLFPAFKKSGRDLVPRSEVRSGPAFRPGKHSLAQRQKFMPARREIFKSGERRGERAGSRGRLFCRSGCPKAALKSRSAPKSAGQFPGRRRGKVRRAGKISSERQRKAVVWHETPRKEKGRRGNCSRPAPSGKPRSGSPEGVFMDLVRGLGSAPFGRAVQAFRGVKFSKMMLSIRSFF